MQSCSYRSLEFCAFLVLEMHLLAHCNIRPCVCCRQGRVQGSPAERAGLCSGPQGAPGRVDRAPRFSKGSRCSAAVCGSHGAEGLPGQHSFTLARARARALTRTRTWTVLTCSSHILHSAHAIPRIADVALQSDALCTVDQLMLCALTHADTLMPMPWQLLSAPFQCCHVCSNSDAHADVSAEMRVLS